MIPKIEDQEAFINELKKRVALKLGTKDELERMNKMIAEFDKFMEKYKENK